MKEIKLLIVHNKPPNIHDLMTEQAKNICDKLLEKCNLHIIWAIFPTFEKKIFEKKGFDIHNANDYDNTLELIKNINPDMILINGSMDFHNIECSIVGKHLKIPIIVFFLRNLLSRTPISVTGVLKSRFRGLFFKNRLTTEKEKPLRLIPFYLRKYYHLYKTLRVINYSISNSIINILQHVKNVLLVYSPIEPIIEGTINLCTTENWKVELKRKFTKNSIKVIGDPYFDKVFDEISKIKMNDKRDYKKTRVLFATSTMYAHGLCSRESEYQLIIDTCNQILKDENIELTLKIHPSTSDFSEIENFVIKKLSRRINIFQKENLLELIDSNHLMVTYGGSGAIRHSILLGMPVINLNFDTEVTGNNIFIDDKAIIQCKSLKKLLEIIEQNKFKKLNNNDIQNFIIKYLGKFDGQSSERAAIQILKMIN